MRALSRYRAHLLGLGAALGLGLAAAGAFAVPSAGLSDHVVARVNGTGISHRQLDLAVKRTRVNRFDAEGRRVSSLAPTAEPQATTQAQRRQALELLIDQELLIQRGVSLGLVASDRTVRKALAMAMIDRTVAQVLAHEPSEDVLRAFYATHRAVFSLPGRLRVRQITFPAAERAQAAAAALRDGMSFAEASRRFGQPAGAPLPDSLLPAHVLHRYLGPSLTRAALGMEAGEVSAPLASPLGYHILRVAERQAERLRPYSEVRAQVRAEYYRRERDRALERVLDRLRRRATLVVAADAPQR